MIKTSLDAVLSAIENYVDSEWLEDNEDKVFLFTRNLKETADHFYQFTKEDLKVLNQSDETNEKIIQQVMGEEELIQDSWELFLIYRSQVKK